MKGAIIGDIIGSVYEFHNIDEKTFPLFSKRSRFTDDTIMTCAVAKALLECGGEYSLLTPEHITETMQGVGRKYPNAGYGARFIHWMFSDHPEPYNSFGNGSAMRISPVGDVAMDLEMAKDIATKISAVSHNHEEGIKGAVCIAECMVLLKQGADKERIRRYVEEKYYRLDKSCDDYRMEQAGQHGQEICQVSVPQAIVCFLESTDFEDCMRNCISIGGDSDTIAAIAGGLAEAYYGVPDDIWVQAESYLDDTLRDIVREFYKGKVLPDTEKNIIRVKPSTFDADWQADLRNLGIKIPDNVPSLEYTPVNHSPTPFSMEIDLNAMCLVKKIVGVIPNAIYKKRCYKWEEFCKKVKPNTIKTSSAVLCQSYISAARMEAGQLELAAKEVTV